jgi:hypothetical protein
MPGFSRHHWGTEIDVVSAERPDWEGARARFAALIPFLRDEAPKFGFFQPYSSRRPNQTLPHYENEPWHLSYWPRANVLEQQWAARITGTVLDNLERLKLTAIGEALLVVVDENQIAVEGLDCRAGLAPPKRETGRGAWFWVVSRLTPSDSLLEAAPYEQDAEQDDGRATRYEP